MVFRLGSLRVKWITLALQTIGDEHRNLRRISIEVHPNLTRMRAGRDVRRTVGEGILEQCLDLDQILVHLWESYSIRPSVIRPRTRGAEVGVVDRIEILLPEMTRRGMIELIE